MMLLLSPQFYPFPGNTYPAALNKEKSKKNPIFEKNWLKKQNLNYYDVLRILNYMYYIYPHPQKSIYQI